MTDEELFEALREIKDLMTDVSTGGADIKSVNSKYRDLYVQIKDELRKRNIPNPNSFSDLWDWHVHWSSGAFPSYKSRRKFLAEMFAPVQSQVQDRTAGTVAVNVQPTGWEKVDRIILDIRKRLAEAKTEVQFQSVGLLCREAFISLGQSVYDPELHPPVDDKTPSETDAKRMLEAYIASKMPGSSDQELRKHARASFDLANKLQHQRTATFRDAAISAEATSAVVNLIAIVSGRRDP